MMERVRLFDDCLIRLGSCDLERSLSSEQAHELAELLAGMDPWLTLGFSAQGLYDYLDRVDDGLIRYAVSVDEKTVGVLAIRYPWLRGPYVELLAVAKAYQGRGVGKAILTWLEQEVKPFHRNLWVVASSFNQPAIAAYEHFGFSKVGLLEDLVKDEFDEILLRKKL